MEDELLDPALMPGPARKKYCEALIAMGEFESICAAFASAWFQ